MYADCKQIQQLCLITLLLNTKTKGILLLPNHLQKAIEIDGVRKKINKFSLELSPIQRKHSSITAGLRLSIPCDLHTSNFHPDN